MKTTPPAPNYRGYRFPPEIISHCVWLYFRFSLRFRDIEEMMAERGVVLTYETVRQWCLKFGQMYANGYCQLKFFIDELSPLRCHISQNSRTNKGKKQGTIPTLRSVSLL